MPSKFTRFLRNVALSLLCAAGFASPASAVIITGAWDPVYGFPFNVIPGQILGWKGSATFEIPDVCLVPGLVSSTSCSGMSLRTAEVTFYDANTNNTIQTFTYAPSALTGFQVQVGTSGQIQSLSSDYFAPVFPTSTFAGINFFGFELHFVTGGVQMFHTVDYYNYPLFSPDNCLNYPGFVCGYSGVMSGSGGGGGSTATAIAITFNVVPEPGTIALLLSAGLIGIAVQRRRAQRIR